MIALMNDEKDEKFEFIASDMNLGKQMRLPAAVVVVVVRIEMNAPSKTE